ncbi:hypothetical protein JXA12_00745 [Candidatus Woesearchaeota archaeon]|nr:hypothetical protein [Candidatus Woesearchaeota archaeon]
MADPTTNVAPEHVFHFHDGKKAHNLQDLRDAIASANEESFAHHVDDENNDFANWAEFVYKNPELAEDLREAADRKRILEVLDAELGRYGGDEAPDDPVPEPEEPDHRKPAKQLHEDPFNPTHPPQSIEHDGEVLHTVSTEAVHHFITKEFVWGLVAGILMGLVIMGVLIQLNLIPV